MVGTIGDGADFILEASEIRIQDSRGYDGLFSDIDVEILGQGECTKSMVGEGGSPPHCSRGNLAILSGSII